MSARLEVALVELAAAIREEIRAEMVPTAPDRLLSVEEAGGLLGIGRSVTYGELQAGRLRSVKVGRRRLVPATSVAQFIADRQGRP